MDQAGPGQAIGEESGKPSALNRLSEHVMSLPLFPEAPRGAPPGGRLPIAVIGAGFSGTIATLQLLRRLPHDQPVLLCERARDFARGVAYATGNNNHLLNVRAANMSAFAEETLHFQDWLKSRISDGNRAACLHDTPAGVFASRGLYGRYLRSLLDEAMRASAGHAQLRLLPDEVVDVVEDTLGTLQIVCAGGQTLKVAAIVLAVGNLSPEESDDPLICHDAWGEKAWRPLDPDRPVLIVGAGLTMVDLAVGLRRRGFMGGIVALSRSGRLPASHAGNTGTWPTPNFTASQLTSMAALMSRLRHDIRAAAAQGVDWRAVIDSLRPVTARLWAGLPLAERQRFLRHARRLWDVHRHRMAPPHAEMIAAMQEEGSLSIISGRLCGMQHGDGGVIVRYRPRPVPRRANEKPGESPGERSLHMQRVIMASGLENLSRTQDRLMQRLLDRGLVRADPQGMGVEVNDALRAVPAEGVARGPIWALGPIVRGVFWECVAVPDIRQQAARVAESVAANLQEDAPSWSFMI